MLATKLKKKHCVVQVLWIYCLIITQIRSGLFLAVTGNLWFLKRYPDCWATFPYRPWSPKTKLWSTVTVLFCIATVSVSVKVKGRKKTARSGDGKWKIYCTLIYFRHYKYHITVIAIIWLFIASSGILLWSHLTCHQFIF